MSRLRPISSDKIRRSGLNWLSMDGTAGCGNENTGPGPADTGGGGGLSPNLVAGAFSIGGRRSRRPLGASTGTEFVGVSPSSTLSSSLLEVVNAALDESKLAVKVLDVLTVGASAGNVHRCRSASDGVPYFNPERRLLRGTIHALFEEERLVNFNAVNIHRIAFQVDAVFVEIFCTEGVDKVEAASVEALALAAAGGSPFVKDQSYLY
ncbi:hypothetical protein HG530_008007 [Fusarium avenaceum]|nr:hypothetical protein HG530_008007 [Fusarium avenaceum]